jgi:hypothetical protein
VAARKRVEHYRELLDGVKNREAGLAAEIAKLGGDPRREQVRAVLYQRVDQLAEERDGYVKRLADAEADRDREAERQRHLAQLDTLADQLAQQLDTPLTRTEMVRMLKLLHPEVYVGSRSGERPRFELFFNVSGCSDIVRQVAAALRTPNAELDQGTWSWYEAPDDIRVVTLFDAPHPCRECNAPFN